MPYNSYSCLKLSLTKVRFPKQNGVEIGESFISSQIYSCAEANGKRDKWGSNDPTQKNYTVSSLNIYNKYNFDPIILTPKN